jgi:hypothetical protein
VGVEVHPWPENVKWLGFLLNVSGGFPLGTLSGDSDGPYPWFNVGLGAHVVL